MGQSQSNLSPRSSAISGGQHLLHFKLPKMALLGVAILAAGLLLLPFSGSAASASSSTSSTFAGQNSFESVPPSPFPFAGGEEERTQEGGDQFTGWTSWGHDLLNSRFNPTVSELKANNLNRLKLKWSFVFPDALSASSQPAIVGNTLYVGSWNAKFYALNAQTGQLKWSYDTASFTGPVPTGLSNGVRDGPAVVGGKVYFGDLLGNLYALNARTGAQIWAKKLDQHLAARITGSPIVWQGRVYVGMSSFETGLALAPNYPCCTFRGSLSALDANTGAVIWRYETITEPLEQQGVTIFGTPRYGPSGVPIWSTPAIDPFGGLLYFGTGQNYSNPTTSRSDSLIALELATGKERWVKQLTPNDGWDLSCNPEAIGLPPGSGPNCPLPPANGKDFDFGSSPNLFVAFKDGKLRRLVGAGQKSGIYHVLDAQTGQIVWQTRLSSGGVAGSAGIQWGASWDGEQIYVATHDAKPGTLFALDPATGKVLWSTPNPANGCTTGGAASDPVDCTLAMPAATTVIPGLVFEGSWDGKLRAFNSRDGAIVWQYDTVRSFIGTNGLVGKGGSINGAGVTIVGEMVYVNSGYQPFPKGGIAGNVLLAFGR